MDNTENRVFLDCRDVHTIPKDQIEARFLEKSFEFKVRGLNGKNYKFAVPRLQHRTLPESCRYVVKNDKIIITLKKKNAKDVWFSLFRQKPVGGDESD